MTDQTKARIKSFSYKTWLWILTIPAAFAIEAFAANKIVNAVKANTKTEFRFSTLTTLLTKENGNKNFLNMW